MSNYWILVNKEDIPLLKSLGVIIDTEINPPTITTDAKEFHATISDLVMNKLDPFFYKFIWGPLNIGETK